MLWFTGVYYFEEGEPEDYAEPSEHRVITAESSDQAFTQARTYWNWVLDEYDVVAFTATPIIHNPQKVHVTVTVELEPVEYVGV